MNSTKYEKQAEKLSSIVRCLYNKNVSSVLEIGARDCKESIYFSNTYPNSKIYSFECNPDTLSICRKRISNVSNVTLVESAVSELDGEVSFYKINQEKTKTTWSDGNPGASSLFQASGKYEVEDYVQDEIKVKSTRLDSFLKDKNIESVDILWMDIQGSELAALRSLGEYIKRVSFIHSEVEFFEIYKDQPLFKDIKKYLNNNNFYLYTFTNIGKYSGDAVFINKKVFLSRPLFLISLLFRDKFVFIFKKYSIKRIVSGLWRKIKNFLSLIKIKIFRFLVLKFSSKKKILKLD